ncbi:MAG: hypothetical protein RIQ81_735 [Pseudomonadota bacterium]
MGRGYAAILIAALAGATTAGAYPVPVDFGGKLVRWDINSPDTLLYYEVVNESSLADSTAFNMVQSAAGLWSAVDGSLLRLAETLDTAQNPAQITIHFQSNFDGGSFAAAYASFDRTDDKGRPSHCLVNVAIRGGEALGDLEKTVLHELGHCLGLGHSLFPRAIMSYRLEQNSFQLDVDDEAALRGLYPVDGAEPAIPPGCVVGHQRSAAAEHGVIIDLLWILLFSVIPMSRLTRRLLQG